MKRLRSSLLLVAAAAVFSLILLFSSSGACAAEFHVPKDYATIQAAISAATGSTSDTVIVEPNIIPYSGQIIMKNNVSIRGAETARTYLSNSSGPVVIASGQINATIQNFTFLNAPTGIQISNNSAAISIRNNVFHVALGGTAITEQNSPSTTVVNNTFYNNGTALACDADLEISNNIFSLNTTAIDDKWPVASITKISNNFFDNLLSSPTATNPLTGDPSFVDPANLDFHLKEGSPCINPGNASLSVGNPTANDIGAYGGAFADTIPFPVSGLEITSTTDTSIGIKWSPNNSYLVTNLTNTTLAGGYNLYVGPSPGDYTGALTSSGTISSPINVNAVLQNPSLYPSISCTSASCTLTDLTPATTPPAAPDNIKSSPRDSRLVLTWTAVPGATGYEVHYGISSPNENVIDTQSAATSYELSGLTNSQHYLIAVTAYAQQQYFFNVTAYDNQFNNSASTPFHESAKLVANEKSIQIGQKQFSALSLVISDFPEALTTYPALPNTGGRCFIATAAYGYYSAPEVQALRDFRDRYLLTSAAGRMFVAWYYEHGPAAAEFLNDHPGYKPVVRAALMPAVGTAIFLTGTSTMFKAIVLLVLGGGIAFGFFRKRLAGTGGLR